RHLFIGSEGTLGFVTDALIRVTLKPGPSWVLVLGAPDLAAVMNVFETFQSAVPLTAFELFTDQALTHVLANDSNLQQPFQTRAPYYILIQSELADGSIEEKCLSLFEQCLEKGWVMDGVVSQGETHSRQMWKLRENISEALSKFTPYKNDISVRVSKCTQFLTEADRLLKTAYPDFEVVWFGHVGDGNLHISILKPAALAMDEFVKRCQIVDRILFETIAKYGGSISAEHGVGLSKKPFLGYTRSQEEIALMKSLKSIFDPAHILNPGKIFDFS
ncbi:MAG: FAD-binding oxidoreductase, partial [Bdellovibrionales bacterium]|nr:FAD-binding oxidoreductase [Bdellovibrionales bacterium]